MRHDVVMLRRRMLMARNDAIVLGDRAWRLRMQSLALAVAGKAAAK